MEDAVHLLKLSRPWWELVLRAASVYAMLFALVRLFGKREIGKFTPFDFIFLLIIGAAVSRAIVGGDRSLTAAAIVVVTLAALNYVVGYISLRWQLADRFIEGRPVILVKDGKVKYETLRREGITKNDLLAALRKHGCDRPSDAARVVLETAGSITVKKRE